MFLENDYRKEEEIFIVLERMEKSVHLVEIRGRVVKEKQAF